MVFTDPIADFLTRIRNGQRAHLATVDIPHSKMKANLAELLKREGFLGEYRVLSEGSKRLLRVNLRYRKDGKPMISEIRRLSKPGCRVYMDVPELKKRSRDIAISFVSTSKGILTHHEAVSQNAGGELVCRVL